MLDTEILKLWDLWVPCQRYHHSLYWQQLLTWSALDEMEGMSWRQGRIDVVRSRWMEIGEHWLKELGTSWQNFRCISANPLPIWMMTSLRWECFCNLGMKGSANQTFVVWGSIEFACKFSSEIPRQGQLPCCHQLHLHRLWRNADEWEVHFFPPMLTRSHFDSRSDWLDRYG